MCVKIQHSYFLIYDIANEGCINLYLIRGFVAQKSYLGGC